MDYDVFVVRALVARLDDLTAVRTLASVPGDKAHALPQVIICFGFGCHVHSTADFSP